MSNLAVMNGAFEEKGVILASCPENSTTDIEKFVDMAIEAGAENVTLEKDENGCDVLQVGELVENNYFVYFFIATFHFPMANWLWCLQDHISCILLFDEYSVVVVFGCKV